MDEYTNTTTIPVQRLHLPLTPIRMTYVLIITNIIVFVLQMFWEGTVYQFGALVPVWIIFSRNWWRLLTAGFLHGGPMHIAANLYALYGLGQLTERFFGIQRFIVIYFVSLLGSSVLVTIFSPMDSITVGASGAVMGVLGALMFFFQQYRKVLVGGQGFFSELLRMAVLNIGIGFLPGISLWGHLGGVVAGLLAGWILCPRYQRVARASELERLPLTPWMRLNVVLMPVGWLLLLGIRIVLARSM